MPFGVLKNRRKVNLTLDNKFAAWLHHKSKETGTPISRIVEIATIEKYKQEYEAFEYKGGEDMSTKSTTLKLLVGAIVTATLFGASGTLPEKVYAAETSSTTADTATITKTATLSNVKISINGATPVEIRGYNIDGNNYFRIADIGKVLNMKVMYFPTQLGDGVKIVTDKAFDGTVENFPTETQLTVTMKTIYVFYDGGYAISQCFNYNDRNYIRLADIVAAANLDNETSYNSAVDGAEKGIGQAIHTRGIGVNLKTSYDSSTKTIAIATTKTDYQKLYEDMYTELHGKSPMDYYKQDEAPKQSDIKAQPELTQAPEVGTILAKILKDTSKPAYIDGKANWENFTDNYARTNAGGIGDCVWYAKNRFAEVTGYVLPSMFPMFDLDEVADYQQLNVITDPNKIVARSIAVFGKQHALFVEYVERDTQGNPTYIYFSEANQGTNAIYTPDKDGVIKKLDFKAFVNRQATYSGCITLK